MQTRDRTIVDGLSRQGIRDASAVHWSPATPVLYEHIVKRNEGAIARFGPMLVRTGRFTGRTPKDKFIVREPSSEDRIWWAGNKPFDPAAFDRLHHKVADYLQGRELFVQDAYVGADPEQRLAVRVINEMAWHSLFSRNMLIRNEAGFKFDDEPDFTVISVPHFQA